MNRETIYAQLQEQIPYISRHECVARVMQATDVLLDMLVEVQHDEALDLLQDEQEVGYGL